MAFPPHHQHGFMFYPHEDNTNNNIIHHDHLPSPNSSLNSLPSCPPQLFPSGGGGGNFIMKRSMSFSGMERNNNFVNNEQLIEQVNNGEDELSDDGSQLGEKKKRLNIEQVKALEKSFELGNKLEPERKMQLAKALGLQPRQIAIWFQNRRARWKTKQLEKDYEVLRKQFDALKADNDVLQAQNKKLQAELQALKNRDSTNEVNLKKDNDQNSWSNGSENSCDINLDISRTQLVTTTSPVSSNTTKHHQHNLFSTSMRPTSMTEILQVRAGKSDHHHLQCLKADQLVQEESFCNMFNGIDEQQAAGFWHWPDQHSAFSMNQPHFSNN